MKHAPAEIIIADDDRDITALLRAVFETEGYQVHCCYSGQEAYEAIQRLHPRIVLLDMKMERNESGLEVVERIHTESGLGDVVFLVHSADITSIHRLQSRLEDYGCQIVEKPFNIRLLLHLVAASFATKERAVGQEPQ